MTDAETRAFLEAGRDLQVGSINADGTPHLVTMWYELDADDICFWTYGKSQKVVNLRRDPRLSVLVATGEVYEELRGVSIIGHAELIETLPEVTAFGLHLFGKYWGPAEDELVRAGVEAQATKRVVIRVKADKTVTWDHSKLAGVY
jgi:PPOX class probable F420-dependent enzyme